MSWWLNRTREQFAAEIATRFAVSKPDSPQARWPMTKKQKVAVASRTTCRTVAGSKSWPHQRERL